MGKKIDHNSEWKKHVYLSSAIIYTMDAGKLVFKFTRFKVVAGKVYLSYICWTQEAYDRLIPKFVAAVTAVRTPKCFKERKDILPCKEYAA